MNMFQRSSKRVSVANLTGENDRDGYRLADGRDEAWYANALAALVQRK
jgi:hypothetical protein